jgi:potassium efflux system protein
MDDQSLRQLITQQFEISLVYLQRPAVQRQLLILIALVPLSLLLAGLLRRWLVPLLQQSPRWQRWSEGLAKLVLPGSILLLGYGAALILNQLALPEELITDALNVVWIWAVYRVVLALLLSRYDPETVRPFQRRILLPAFVFFIAWRLAVSFTEIQSLTAVTVFRAFGSEFALGAIVEALVVFYIFVVLAWVIRSSLGRVMRQNTDADPGVINSVTTISGYLLILIGLAFSFSALGLSLSSLALIGGGLSVGIGLGLQDIVANFISGIVLLFEQSLRPGDVIELNGQLGTVEKLNIRSTVIRTNDNVEVVVPNQFFLTTEVRTFTKSDRVARLLLPVGASYDSDPKQVSQLLLQACENHPAVLQNPAPHVFFRAFGESSLDFELAVWTDQPQRTSFIKGELYFAVWDSLKAAGIEIPFPQRDLHLRTGWDKVASTPRAEAQEPEVGSAGDF